MPDYASRKRLKKKLLDRWENEGGLILEEQPQTTDGGGAPNFDADDRWAVILAGGEGLPRRHLIPQWMRGKRPTHFTRKPGEEIVVNKTRKQIALAFPPERTLFAVTESHSRYYEKVLADAPAENLIVEPQDDGTTFAVLYSVIRLAKMKPGAMVAFFPPDFQAADAGYFMSRVGKAFDAARLQPKLILLGIEPENADDGREWIEPDSVAVNAALDVWQVRGFWDNPTPAQAQELMNRGGLRHSSVMVGTVSTFLRKISRASPQIFARFARARTKIGTPDEETAIRSVYHGNFSDTDFSHDVLAKSADKLAVIPVRRRAG